MNYLEILKHYVDEENKIFKFPAKRKLKIVVLFFIAEKFEKDKKYNEKEVNELISNYISFGDAVTIRRELCDYYFLCRKLDCSEYWLNNIQPKPEQYGLETYKK